MACALEYSRCTADPYYGRESLSPGNAPKSSVHGSQISRGDWKQYIDTVKHSPQLTNNKSGESSIWQKVQSDNCNTLIHHLKSNKIVTVFHNPHCSSLVR